MDSEVKLSHEQSLRAVLPTLYNYFITELENLHIHAYDIQANAVEKEDGYQINIKFGDNFSQIQTQFFSFKSIEEMDAPITEYIKDIGERCKQVMIADYFKMMKM